jgi:hypothetical protein
MLSLLLGSCVFVVVVVCICSCSKNVFVSGQVLSSALSLRSFFASSFRLQSGVGVSPRFLPVAVHEACKSDSKQWASRVVCLLVLLSSTSRALRG